MKAIDTYIIPICWMNQNRTKNSRRHKAHQCVILYFRTYDNIRPFLSLQWRHNGRDSVSNHQPDHCLLNGLFSHRSKKTSKLRVTGLCAVNSPRTCEFPAQMASNAENVSIWWRHHDSTPSEWCPHDLDGSIYPRGVEDPLDRRTRPNNV